MRLWLFAALLPACLCLNTRDNQPKDVWVVRLLTILDGVPNAGIKGKAVSQLVDKFDVSYVKFENSGGDYCNELKNRVENLKTTVFVIHDLQKNCHFDEVVDEQSIFSLAFDTSDPTVNWQNIRSSIETGSISELRLVEEKSEEASSTGIPLFVAIGLGAIIVALVGIIVYMILKRNKEKKQVKKSPGLESKKPKSDTFPGSEKSGKSKKNRHTCIVMSKSSSGKKRVKNSQEPTSTRSYSEKSSKSEDSRTSKCLDADGEPDNLIRSDMVTKPPSPPGPLRRSQDKLLEVPITSSEFKFYLHKLSNIIVEYCDDPTNYLVTPNEKPGFLYSTISKRAPEEPEDFKDICKDLTTKIYPGITHWQHPRFHAYFPTGRNYACMMADLLISSMGVVGFSWDSCPALTEMEHAMVNWIGRALGLPEVFLFQDVPEDSVGGGVMFETASEAIHSSLMASRQRKIQQLSKKVIGTQNKGGISYDMKAIHTHCRKLVAYTSKDAHSSIEKGCKLALMRCRPIQASEKNDWGLTGEDIEKSIKRDLAKGLVPTHIHLTIGTTSNAASDHILSVLPIAEKYDMWVHVDAAYAGSTWIDPKHRHHCAGLERVHSIDVNMHKFLMHSVGCSLFWTRDQKTYKDAFAITPVYLKPTHANTTDLRDWGVQLSRRFMCLKTWIILRMYGVQGLRNYVNNLIDMAIYFESLVVVHPNCRIFGKRNFAMFCFQYVEEGMTHSQINAATQKLCQFMNASHKIFLTHTRIADNNLIRISVNYDRSTKTTVDESWAVIQNLIEEFKIVKNEPSAPVVRDALPGRKLPVMSGDVDYGICGSANSGSDRSRVSPGVSPCTSGTTLSTGQPMGVPLDMNVLRDQLSIFKKAGSANGVTGTTGQPVGLKPVGTSGSHVRDDGPPNDGSGSTSSRDGNSPKSTGPFFSRGPTAPMKNGSTTSDVVTAKTTDVRQQPDGKPPPYPRK